jgi:hypothetical protein
MAHLRDIKYPREFSYQAATRSLRMIDWYRSQDGGFGVDLRWLSSPSPAHWLAGGDI